MKRGKRYVEAAKLVDRASLYEAADAICHREEGCRC